MAPGDAPKGGKFMSVMSAAIVVTSSTTSTAPPICLPLIPDVPIAKATKGGRVYVNPKAKIDRLDRVQRFGSKSPSGGRYR